MQAAAVWYILLFVVHIIVVRRAARYAVRLVCTLGPCDIRTSLRQCLGEPTQHKQSRRKRDGRRSGAKPMVDRKIAAQLSQQ